MDRLGAAADEVAAVHAVAAVVGEAPRIVGNIYFWQEDQIPRIEAAFKRYRDRPRVTSGRARSGAGKRWEQRLAGIHATQDRQLTEAAELGKRLWGEREGPGEPTESTDREDA
jgi:hypothetical protein